MAGLRRDRRGPQVHSAFERQHIPGNLANVLCTLLRLGDVIDARDLRDQVMAAFPPEFTRELARMIQLDPDLALLRTEDSP